jgi:hypothetical protein
MLTCEHHRKTITQRLWKSKNDKNAERRRQENNKN